MVWATLASTAVSAYAASQQGGGGGGGGAPAGPFEGGDSTGGTLNFGAVPPMPGGGGRGPLALESLDPKSRDMVKLLLTGSALMIAGAGVLAWSRK